MQPLRTAVDHFFSQTMMAMTTEVKVVLLAAVCQSIVIRFGITCAIVGCLIIAPLHFGFCFTLATYLSTSFYLDTLLTVQASRKC